MPTSQKLPAALVTGGAGFIGSHLVRALLRQNRARVVVLDDLSGGFAANVPPDAVLVDGSITDEALVNRLFDQHRFRHVYHLAAYAAEGLSHFIRRFNYTNNVLGSVNLINASIRHEIDCFVFTSSIAVYGSIASPMREEDTPKPEDPYGIAKLAVELDLEAARRVFGLRYVIFRPHNVYGEYQNLGDPYRNVIGIFMNQVMQGKPMTIFGDGLQQRAFTHVGDIVPAIAESPWVVQSHNQTFNIGADTPYTINQLAAEVATAMGCPRHPLSHLPARPEVQIAYGDHARARRVFGKNQQLPLSEGLARMATWAQSAGIRKAKPFDRIELTRQLPSNWRQLLPSGACSDRTGGDGGSSGPNSAM